MKYYLLLLLAAATTVTASADETTPSWVRRLPGNGNNNNGGGGGNGCHDCSCFTCGVVQEMPDGSLDVTIDHCKDGTISWMCCVGVNGGQGNCEVVAPCSGPKCETIGTSDFTINIPASTTTFSINTHDGKTSGDSDNVFNVCGGSGNQGGSCKADGTAHCLIDFDLATDCGYTAPARTSGSTDAVCELPSNADEFSVVTFGNAYIGAHSMYKGLAVGETLYDDTPNEDGTVDRTKSYILNLDGNTRFIFNGGKQTGSGNKAKDMQARMQYLAANAVTKDYSDGHKVVKLTYGGRFSTQDFLGQNGQGEDNGKTLIIFDTTEDIYLTKTPSGRQFGPTIIAPYAKVIVEDDAGFVDGSIYCMTLKASGGSLQLHGDTYTGSIDCEGVNNEPERNRMEVQPQPTDPPTEAPGDDSEGYCNWNNCDGNMQGGDYCNKDNTHCTSGCGGTWCEPTRNRIALPPTDPPTAAGGDDDGYCNWNNCDGNMQGGDYCNKDGTHCMEGCGGTWCGSSDPDPTDAPTDAPTVAPTDAPTEAAKPKSTPAPEPVANPAPPRGSGSGDPHFKTYSGEKYDYHGECDLVLIDNPSFADGLGMRLHIRTTRVKYFSYIERVALQIGNDVLEFENNVEQTRINGAVLPPDVKHHKHTLGGGQFEIRHDRKAISVRLDKHAKAKIDFHSRKNGFPAVIVDAGNSTSLLNGSLGMLGDWPNGKRVARDGTTLMEDKDATAFALEWQVRDTEPMLFAEARHPQYPTTCTPPKQHSHHGLMGGMKKMQQEAEKACAHWKEDKEDCIFDVIATRDVSVAQEGHIVHLEYHHNDEHVLREGDNSVVPKLQWRK